MIQICPLSFLKICDMKNKLLIACAIALLGSGWWLFHYFSDKEVIKRQFTAIAEELGKAGKETPIVIALKMKQVSEFLARSCEVAVPERNYLKVMEPGLVIRYIIIYRDRHTTLLVAIDDLIINIPNKGRAELSASVHVSGNTSQAGFFEEIHRVEFSLQKADKKWLIHKVTLPEALVR